MFCRYNANCGQNNIKIQVNALYNLAALYVVKINELSS